VSLALVTVGTGTVTPHPMRTSAAHWVAADDVRLLLDCGAGTLHGLARCGLPWTDLTHVAITHFHQDHLGELPALLFAMKYGALAPRAAPLVLLGPAGFRDALARIAAAFGDWVTAPGWPLDVVEVAPGTPLTLAAEVSLAAHRTPHTPESLAYAVATSARRLVYTGDTGPSDALGDWAAGCDLLLAECSLPEAMALDIHLTPAGAGRLAARANAKSLVLTHLYPPVEAVDIVAEVRRSYAGPVTVAHDGARFDLR
jgi:ribonuclease BN (tRNA processing enzyme)